MVKYLPLANPPGAHLSLQLFRMNHYGGINAFRVVLRLAVCNKAQVPLRPLLQVVNCAKDQAVVESLELSSRLEKLSLAEPLLPKYENIFRGQWAGGRGVEDRHRQLMDKIYGWPRNSQNEVRLPFEVIF